MALNKEFVFSKRVFLTDTNAEGNVYFARYFEWQGMAREDYFRQAVPNHMAIMQSGTKLITVHAWLRYESETHLFDEVLIKVQTTVLKKMSMELSFTYVNKQTGQRIATGSQKLAFAGPDGRLIPVPTPIRIGASSCMVAEGSEIWKMQLMKRRVTTKDLLTSYENTEESLSSIE